MLLDIRNLTIEVARNNGKQILCKNLNFTIYEGETIGILGESGSGKSITALSILNLLPSSITVLRGKIDYVRKDGSLLNLLQTTNKKLNNIRGKEISMVFQEPMTSLNPAFTCGNQVLETIRRHQIISFKDAKRLVIGLFNKVKLPDPLGVFNSYPHQLSGGQKQRVMIAIAICCNPRLLIADEPTTALDVTVQKSILELLKEIQAEMGMSILFITHDINVISEIAKRLLIFYKGEIVEQGTVGEILVNPKHPYTKGLLGCRTSVYRKGERLKTLEETFPKPEDRGEEEILFKDDRSEVPSAEHNDSFPASDLLRTSLLHVRDLNVSFSRSNGIFTPRIKKQVLQHIDFEVMQGETLGLVGESGSGKTTIGRVIMQLIESDSGSIEYKGERISSLSNNKLKGFKKNVQIIFQDPYSSLNPKKSIGEIIKEPLVVHHLFKNSLERKNRVIELLRQVGLNEEHYDRYPHQFSGGQRQRIGIARVLAVEPQIIILDESVSALDVSIQAQILNLLNDLKQKYNLTYIFISHDLNTVRFMADRIIVLKEGIIIEHGNSEEVFKSPKNSYTINLIESIPGVKS